MNLNKLLVNVFPPDDRQLAVVGLTIAIMAILGVGLSTQRLIFVFAAIFIGAACAIWLVARKRVRLGFSMPSVAAHWVLTTVFCGLLLACLLVQQHRSEPYVRPLMFFVLFALAGGVLAVEVLVCPLKKFFWSSSFLQTIVLSAVLVWSELVTFHNVVAIDSWFHQNFTNQILRQGLIPTGFSYSGLPLFHLVTGEGMMLTGLEYKFAVFFVLTVIQLGVNGWVVFSLAKRVGGVYAGLLAALLMAVSNLNTFWAIETVPNSLAVTFTLAILYLLIEDYYRHSVQGRVVIILLLMALVMTHSIMSLILLLLMVIVWMSFKFLPVQAREGRKTHLSASLGLFLAIFTLAWWLYESGHLANLVEAIKWGFSRDRYTGVSTLGDLQAAKNYWLTVPLSEQVGYNLGLFIYGFLGVLGSLYLLKKASARSMTLAYVGLAPFALAFGAILAGLGLFEERMMYIGEITLSIASAITLLLFLSLFGQRKAAGLIVGFIVIAPLSFGMAISPQANFDNLSFAPHLGVRYALTDSEFGAAAFAVDHWNRHISSDFFYATSPSSSVFLNYFGVSERLIVPLDQELYSGHFSDEHSLKIVRRYVLDHPMAIYRGVIRVNSSAIEILGESYSRVYDNGQVVQFLS